jgi:hypothetical protein
MALSATRTIEHRRENQSSYRVGLTADRRYDGGRPATVASAAAGSGKTTLNPVMQTLPWGCTVHRTEVRGAGGNAVIKVPPPFWKRTVAPPDCVATAPVALRYETTPNQRFALPNP